jgi:hypothetical protein
VREDWGDQPLDRGDCRVRSRANGQLGSWANPRIDYRAGARKGKKARGFSEGDLNVQLRRAGKNDAQRMRRSQLTVSTTYQKSPLP